MTRLGTRSAAADIVLYDSDGVPVAELSECWFRRVELSRAGGIGQRALRVDLVPAPLDPTPVAAFGDIGEALSELAAAHAGDIERGTEQALLLDALVAASTETRDDLPAPDEIWRLLLAESPDLVAELAVVAAGEPAPAAALDGSPAVAAGIAFVCDALARLAATWPEGRKLRLLELAAGGAATRRVLDRLAQTGVPFAYTATHPDPDEAARLAFTVDEARRWSPRDPDEGFAAGSFDVVLSVDRGQPLDAAALARLGELLGPGGLFLAVEPAPNALWDLAFDGAALRSDAEWRAALDIAGFTGAAAHPLTIGPWPGLALWARAPETAASARAAEAAAAEPAIFVADEAPDIVAHTARTIAALAKVAGDCAANRRRLWVVTQGGLVGGAVWGFGRVLINEMPGLDLRLIELPPGSDPARYVAAEAGTGETEIVWTQAGRHVPRLRRGLPPRWAGAEDAIGLASLRGGGLDALGWREIAPRPLGAGEIEIDVKAAGLNFRDVMWGDGPLARGGADRRFRRRDLRPRMRRRSPRRRSRRSRGSRSATGSSGSLPPRLASRVTTLARAVVPIPDALGFAAAATAPVAFVTASTRWARSDELEAGETVLIHAAAGGVGLAAIQYAKHRGAVVIATAGSPAKRAFLRLRRGRPRARFARPRLCRRGARDHRRRRRRCRAELAERRGDGAEPRRAQAVRPLSRTRQARFLPEPPHPSAAAAAEHLLFRDRRRPAADRSARTSRGGLLGEVAEALARGRSGRWRTASSRSPSSTTRSG